MSMNDNDLHLINELLPELNIKEHASIKDITSESLQDRDSSYSCLVKSDDGDVYQVIMQMTDGNNIGKKVRGLRSYADLQLFERFISIDDLPKTIIVLLTTDDPYQQTLYKRKLQLMEDDDKSLTLGDGIELVVLSSNGKTGTPSNQIRDIVNLMNGSENVEDTFSKGILRDLHSVKGE
ncbi:hypothetical protein FOD75_11415 (plasmid) [Limosilactobacillus reuteri]|uniref:Uncharacterized protein n=2 Tax=Limosilactobacillus reuteri TaxID=1598 RepID=A0A517D8K4_LIMRT|nr:hypothetical protein FOD75_11415 [Limosilactobacillus reuteri]